MSLFTGEAIAMPQRSRKIVLSASRMTDMPKYYPEELIGEVNKRLSQGVEIHTLVLWTKHPHALLTNPLQDYLLGLREQGIQLYVQLTITGLGGLAVGVKSNNRPLILEPVAPKPEDALGALPQVIKLVGKPERIRLRIDPVVRVIDAAGCEFSSLKFLPVIIKEAVRHGVSYFSFSFLEKGVYSKVDKRFAQMGCQICPPSEAEREKTTRWLANMAEEHKIILSACCVEGFPEMRCIDGFLLQELHDTNSLTNKNEPRKRGKCGCTASTDLGGWPPKLCYTGCVYCYANSFRA